MPTSFDSIFETPNSPQPPQNTLDEGTRAQLMHLVSGEVPPHEASQLLSQIRNERPESTAEIDQLLMHHQRRLMMFAKKAEKTQAELRAKIEEVCGEPFFPAIYLGPIDMQSGRRALVQFGNSGPRIVNVDEDSVRHDQLRPGDEVLLGHELNVIRDLMPERPKGGELAPFSRRLEDGRLLLKTPGDDELLVETSPRLNVDDLEAGSLVRYSKSCHFAYEVVPGEAAEENEFFLDDAPKVDASTFADRNGHLRRVSSALRLSFDKEIADRYGLGNTNILMHGPPGCGKTTLARVAVSQVSAEIGEEIRVAVIDGAAFEDPYVGVTQQRITKFFKNVHEAAENQPCVVIFDEAEALGRARGGHCQHSDKFLNTLLSQMQGFRDRSGDRVAFIFLSNRVDNMDNAFYERVTNGGFELAVGRPGMSEARDILGTKLATAPDLPYSPNGSHEAENLTRQEVIETAVSLLFAPNAPNRVCTVKTNDGADHDFHARDLISGRVIEQIAVQTRRSAAESEAAGHAVGITTDHVRQAVGEAVQKMRAAISPGNAHSYLPSLPTDLHVTAVVPAAE